MTKGATKDLARRRTSGDRTVGTRVLAGIDEAGLGPLLGPLAIGYSVLRVPEARPDPWKGLRGLVVRRPGRRSKKLIVADSKKVFSRNDEGWRRLEATVQTFLSLLRADGRPVEDASELLFGPGGPDPKTLARHPWYGRLPALPRLHAADTLELRSAVLRRKMQASELELLDAGVRIATAGELNASYAETSNKARTVWRICLELLRRIWEGHGAEDVSLTVDMLGGRVHYGGLLARGFPDARVRTLTEGPEHAAYELDERDDAAGRRWLPKRMRIDFRVKGEEASFAVALASCLAKYAREVAMEGFNAFFAERDAELRPTAGYTTDGRRWLADADGAIRAARIARRALVRER